MFSLTAFRSFALFFFCFSISLAYAATPPNDNCSLNSSFLLTSSTAGTCSGTMSLQDAGTSTPAGNYGGATSTTTYDVWFTYQAKTTPVTISVNTTGSQLSNSTTYIEVLSGTCGSLMSIASGPASSRLTVNGLTPTTIYYIRVYVTTNPNSPGNATGKYGYTICMTDPPVHDDCNGAVLLTSNTSCSTTPGTMDLATSTSGISSGCAPVGTHYDVWYKFLAANATETVTISNLGTAITNPAVQIFSGACGSLASLACGSSSATATGLVVNSTYYVRVSNVGTDPSVLGTSAFDICLTHPVPPPANDDCSNASLLAIGGGSSAGTVWGATTSTGITAGCATGTPDDDVWYKFTATGAAATISLSGVGTNLSSSGAMVQLFSGSCGTLASLSCGNSTINATGLTNGNTYYIRVYSSGAGSIGGTSTGSSFAITVTDPTALPQATVGSGRMNEVFKQTTLSGAGLLNDPWEVTYGPDGYLWITEAKGYKVYRMDPATGVKTTVLNISQGASGYLTSGEHTAFNVQFSAAQSPWPQGGFAGLAIHPKFMDATTPKNFIYVSYVHSYTGLITTPAKGGEIFVNRVVRFTYNTTTGKLESPVSLCDTLPGSSDHNSQRMIVAPVNGVNYLFYASGDMGSGQFNNANRVNNAQLTTSYEGKILRFNLEPDGDAGTLDQWIPNDNPFNGTVQSAVWATGMRNNQGFAFHNFNGTEILYGTSHGPFSDDELNIIERSKNYGHPLVIGYAADGNYNGSSAGEKTGSLPVIVSETGNAAAIGSSYKDPLFSAYDTSQAKVSSIWNNQTNNGAWPSEAWSGMDIYTDKLIPGWKNSLIIGSLKWGRVLRLKLNSTGTAIIPSDGKDTVSYFGSTNRYRDVAFAPGGKDMFVIMDKSATTSGPSALNPVVPACGGCVLKYTFLGYNTGGTGRSMIPTSIDVTAGTVNTCEAGTTITIDNTNNNLWVPITGPDGNIMAEIKANGNNLGTVTSSFYTNGGAVRENALKRLYLDRNITITPQTQPSSPVSVRLYLTANELAALKNASNSKGPSGVSSIGNISIFKNNDGCGPTWSNTSTPAIITPIHAEAHGGNGFVLQADISSFSSFYFANTNAITLPLQLLTFKGTLQNNTTLLQWETANESNTSHFVVERSVDGNTFSNIGTVAAAGNNTGALKYNYTDYAAPLQSSSLLYYRLRLVDLNGAFTYSKVITIEWKPSSYTVSLYPNPIHDVLKVKLALSKAEQVEIYVTDMNGRTVYRESRFVPTGANELKINTTSWPSQLYSVRVTGTNKNILAAQNVIKL